MIPEGTPERIFLCLGDEDPEPSKFSDHTGVTWSEDQAVGWAVPYVREDLVNKPAGYLERPDSPGYWHVWRWSKHLSKWSYDGITRAKLVDAGPGDFGSWVVYDEPKLCVWEHTPVSELKGTYRFARVIEPPAPPMPEVVAE